MILAPGAPPLAGRNRDKDSVGFREEHEVSAGAAHRLIVSLPAGLGAGLPGPGDPHTRRRHEVA